jgi:RNA polymerase sigma-70 factor (ECF subfamily)
VKLLSSLLEELDEEKREVFVLAELEEMTVPEISQAIEIPVNTVYSRLRAARLAFEEALARHAARRNGGGRPCRT